jgi:hypothetical protein
VWPVAGLREVLNASWKLAFLECGDLSPLLQAATCRSRWWLYSQVSNAATGRREYKAVDKSPHFKKLETLGSCVDTRNRSGKNVNPSCFLISQD